MKLGNGLGASGAYFLKVFLGWAGWSLLVRASCSVLESVSVLLGRKLQSENVMGSEQVGAFWGVCTNCNL